MVAPEMTAPLESVTIPKPRRPPWPVIAHSGSMPPPQNQHEEESNRSTGMARARRGTASMSLRSMVRFHISS